MAAAGHARAGHAARAQQQDAWGPEEAAAVDGAATTTAQRQGPVTASRTPATASTSTPAPVTSATQALITAENQEANHSPKASANSITSATNALPSVAADITSLQSYCVAMVGLYIQDYVQVLGPQLSLLPPDSKATLLAISRRRHTLNDEVFLALLDSTWRFLDVSGTGLDLSAETFLNGLQLLPRLQALDVSGCAHLSSPRMLSGIATCCPHLKLLRCGGSVACNTAMESSLPPLLPGLIKPAVLADSWEDAFTGDLSEEDEPAAHTPAPTTHPQPPHEPSIPSTAIHLSPITSSDNAGPASQQQTCSSSVSSRVHTTTAAAMPSPVRLQKLRQVVWPAVPPSLIQQASQQCPALAFNPGSQAPSQAAATLGKSGRLWQGVAGTARASGREQLALVFCDPSLPMDQLWCDHLPLSTWQGAPKAHLTPFTEEQQARVSADNAAAHNAMNNACAVKPAAQQAQQQPQQHRSTSCKATSASHVRSRDGIVGHSSSSQARLKMQQHKSSADGSGDEEEEEDEPLLPIAERFRQAYIDRASRLKQKAIKQAASASLRQLRLSPAMSAVSQWLDDY